MEAGTQKQEEGDEMRESKQWNRGQREVGTHPTFETWDASKHFRNLECACQIHHLLSGIFWQVRYLIHNHAHPRIAYCAAANILWSYMGS